MLRLFFAIPLSEETIDSINAQIYQSPAFKALAIRPTSRQNMHLTLQFLGDTEERKLPLLQNCLNSVRIDIPSSMKFSEIGYFPNGNAPRVVWLGIQKNSGLNSVYYQLTDALRESGFTIDKKRFVPHITLSRISEWDRRERNFSALTELGKQLHIYETPLSPIVLYKSDLKPTGAVYSVIYKIVL